MCNKNHLKAQKEKHEGVDAQIRLLALCPAHDSLELRTLKKEKLRLKMNITRLENPARATAPKSKPQPKKLKPPKAKGQKTTNSGIVSQLVSPTREDANLEQKAA